MKRTVIIFLAAAVTALLPFVLQHAPAAVETVAVLNASDPAPEPPVSQPAPRPRLVPPDEGAAPEPTPASQRALIQVALLLDTSSSMDGLIDQARTRLWRVVNELQVARRDGLRPRLEIALYEYGNDLVSEKTGHVRQVRGFTSDLDDVSEALFSLGTNGGEEYCGVALSRALSELEWSRRPDVLRLLYIAGNEPFTQGPVPYRPVLALAKARGVVVNTIHCGTADEGARGGWADAAGIADGQYLTIDQNRAVVYVPAPQDEALARLGQELNDTYVSYGSLGAAGRARQQAQDANAWGASLLTMVQRSVSKSSSYYDNSSWDLVDAHRQRKLNVGQVDRRTLPEGLRGLSDAELQAHVEKMEAERGRIKARIAELSEARERFVTDERARRQEEGGDSLDEVLIASLRRQAAQARITFE